MQTKKGSRLKLLLTKEKKKKQLREWILLSEVISRPLCHFQADSVHNKHKTS